MSATKAEKARSDRPGSRSFPLVMAVFAVLLALGVAVGFAIHHRYIGFERTVARHVPADATFVIRWDVEKVTLFEPTRRFLLPLLDSAPRAAPPPSDGRQILDTRRQRLATESGLDIGRDLREALALVGPGEGDWAIVLGGSFPKADVTTALERVLQKEGQNVRRLGPDRFEAASGIAFGRAPDGTFVLASSRARLEAASAVQSLNEAIPRTGAGALLLRADAPGLSRDTREILAELGDVSHIEALADWGSPLVVDVTVHYRGGPPSDAVLRARRVVAELMGPGAVPPTEVVTEDAPPEARVRFRIGLNDEALERAARRTGDSVYGTLWRHGRPEGGKPAAP